MVPVDVRPAAPGDGEQIAVVHVRAWQEGYDGLLDPYFLEALDERERALAWERRLRHGGGEELADTVVLVAERPGGDGPEIVGVATIGPERGGDGSRGELWMINVRPDAWGDGVGPVLLAASRRALERAGYRSSVLWVLDGNQRAQRFYRREGWRPDGAVKVEAIGPSQVRELRYVHTPTSG